MAFSKQINCHRVVVVALLALSIQAWGQGTTPQSYGTTTRSISGYNENCYAGNPPNVLSNVRNIFTSIIESVEAELSIGMRYFNVFSKPRIIDSILGLLPSPSNALYNCWDRKFMGNLSKITSKINAKAMFSSFNPSHKDAVHELRDMILDIFSHDNLDESVSFLEYLKVRRLDIHPQLLVHAIASAAVLSKVFLPFPTPALAEIFPTKFFSNVLDLLNNYQPSIFSFLPKKCVTVNDKWAPENGIENRLWYFREDVQMNLNHWSWHIRNPVSSSSPMPRRGELFYFFHHELMARYASERISNNFTNYYVDKILPSENLVIPQGYTANFMRDGVSSKVWVNRPNNTILNKSTLPNDTYQILLMHTTWYERVKNVTESGIVKGSTGDVILTPDGTNALADIFEASMWSLNKWFYGENGWHIEAHHITGSLIVTPNQSNESLGVIGDVATAMRDPLFYRIHNTVDDIFIRYKQKLLTPYELSGGGDYPLVIPNVVVRSVSVKCDLCIGPNALGTYWNNRNFNIDGGLDFNVQGKNTNPPNVLVCIKHLDHTSFNYNIQVENLGLGSKDVFIRIFMAPRYKTDGKQRFSIDEEFQLTFTLDTFVTKLRPGINNVIRSSLLSSVTSPWWSSKVDIAHEVENFNRTKGECTCGQPHHLLLPKGTEDGMEFDLIVMATDANDFVYKGPVDSGGNPTAPCLSAYVHCGLSGYEYPDIKPMGYPWDRRPSDNVMNGKPRDMENFVDQVPNMAKTVVLIKHADSFIPPRL